VIRFDNEAARLARLVEEIAWGTAWNRWYHAGFRSLSGLPASAAIRAALLLDPGGAAAALAELRGNGRLRLVGEALGEADAWAVARRIEGRGGAPGAGRFAPERLREALAQTRPALIALDLVAQLAGDGGVSSEELEVARHLARAAPVLRSRPGAAWTPGKLIAAARDEGEEAAGGVEALLAEAPALLAEAAEAVAGPPPEALGGAAAEHEFATPYGGLLLLLPALAEVDLEARLAADGRAPEASERLAPLGRWLALHECLPPSAREVARHDPVLAVAAGLPAAPEAAAVAELAGGGRADLAWPRLAADLLRRFARHLPGFERSSPAHLARNFVAGPSRVRVAPTGVTATLPRAPLQVALRVAGWDGSSHAVEWLPGGSLTFEGDGG